MVRVPWEAPPWIPCAQGGVTGYPTLKSQEQDPSYAWGRETFSLNVGVGESVGGSVIVNTTLDKRLRSSFSEKNKQYPFAPRDFHIGILKLGKSFRPGIITQGHLPWDSCPGTFALGLSY